MRALSLLLAAALAAVPSGIGARAATLEDLVSEAATAATGTSMPANGSFEVRLQNRPTAETIGLEGFELDRRTGRFQADAVGREGMQERVHGIAVLSIEVPVAARRIAPGEILTSADVTIDRLPMLQISGDTVTDAAILVGQQARRALAQGRPILESSVGAPIAARRGAKVALVFRKGAMTVSAPGRLLQDGAVGDRVRAVNDLSNKTVVGRLADGSTVEVSP